MVFDIAIILILILFGVYGFRKGFLFTLIHMVGWAVALVGAYFGVTALGNFLKEKTSFYDWLLAGYTSRFTESASNLTNSVDSLPQGLSMSLNDMASSTASGVARSFANLTYLVILFVGLFLVCKVLMWLILRLFSKNYRDGFTGFFDGFFGMLFGILKGIIFVLLLLALMMPLADFFAPDLAVAFADQLTDSMIAKPLYDNNILLILAENFFSSSL